MNNSYLVAELVWPEVKAYLEQEYLAVLPIGAACKEHGHHLPMNTDFIQAEWLAQQTSLLCPSLIWPIMSYGFYPTFVEYPGSCSVSDETFAHSVHDILQGILRAGANRIIILNTGISTVRPLENMLGELNQHRQIILFNVYSGSNFTNAVNEIEQQSIGGHADEIETSIMLALAPEKVDMRKAKIFDAELVAGPLNPNDTDKPNYSPYGL
ncbi:MAG: creatininase family protein, partial [Proteobacteria bacterium]|nr:creatininase family protein [Pseudomonadota bacterium]